MTNLDCVTDQNPPLAVIPAIIEEVGRYQEQARERPGAENSLYI